MSRCAFTPLSITTPPISASIANTVLARKLDVQSPAPASVAMAFRVAH
jgi:hypothetical protein